MFKKVSYGTVLITLFLLGASSCTSSTATNDASAAGGEAARGTAPATQTASGKSTAELKGGIPVPAKRDNLTADDRAAFLRAIGLTEYADNSAQFVKYMAGPTGVGSFKNAGITFFDLGDGRYLVDIMIDQGASLSSSVYALYQESSSGKASAKKLELDSYYPKDGKVVKSTGFEKAGAPSFDAKSKILTIIAPARGTGGCGELTKYKIVSDRAETVEARYQECTNDETLLPPEKWEKLSLTSETTQSATLPVAKSPGISVCAEGYGGNGQEIRDADFAHLKPVHAALLKRWLCYQETNMRPVYEDKTSRSSQTYFRRDHPNDNPFYAVGDFNNNGREDFAVLLVSYAPEISPDTKRKLNALAVFETPAADEAKPKAAYFNDQIDSLFIIAGSADGTLAVASYPSDDGFLLAPQGKTYKPKAMVDF